MQIRLYPIEISYFVQMQITEKTILPSSPNLVGTASSSVLLVRAKIVSLVLQYSQIRYNDNRYYKIATGLILLYNL